MGLFTFGQSGEAHASRVHSRNQFGFQISLGWGSVVSHSGFQIREKSNLSLPVPRPALDKKKKNGWMIDCTQLNVRNWLARPLWAAGTGARRWRLYPMELSQAAFQMWLLNNQPGKSIPKLSIKKMKCAVAWTFNAELWNLAWSDLRRVNALFTPVCVLAAQGSRLGFSSSN